MVVHEYLGNLKNKNVVTDQNKTSDTAGTVAAVCYVSFGLTLLQVSLELKF